MRRRKFILNEDQIQFIKENYLEMTPQQIGDELGLPKGIIRNRMNKLGLIVPRHIVELRIASTRFKPGDVPYTKGKKQSEYMTKEQIERTKKNRFKKNNKPHNTLEGNLVVSIRRDSKGLKYKWIKISDGCWEMLHIFNYQKKHGRIPDNMIVKFIDGDQMNCEPNNLECITKADHLRNVRSNFLELPPEVRETMGLIKKVTNEINNQ